MTLPCPNLGQWSEWHVARAALRQTLLVAAGDGSVRPVLAPAVSPLSWERAAEPARPGPRLPAVTHLVRRRLHGGVGARPARSAAAGGSGRLTARRGGSGSGRRFCPGRCDQYMAEQPGRTADGDESAIDNGSSLSRRLGTCGAPGSDRVTARKPPLRCP